MKTMAIRIDDDVSQQLTVIAQLEQSSVVELIREAIGVLIESRRATGSLAARAEAILADIDREADARRQAIQALVATGQRASEAQPKARGRRTGTPAEGEA